MVLSRRIIRQGVGAGLMAAGMRIGGASSAFAQPTPTPAPPPPGPPPPGCTAADLAQVSGNVATATSVYLFIHPDVNNFFTSLRGQPNNDVPRLIEDYLNANPQVRAELTGIRRPLTDLRNRCQQQ
jgi:heme-binding protein